MKGSSKRLPKVFWPRVVMRKWLNIRTKESDFSADAEDDDDEDLETDSDIQDILQGIRRRKSETFRTQYINTKELRICVGTWNVGGKLPPDDLDIDDWLDLSEPADIYVLGLQEIVPLNAGNVFGAEDIRQVPKWENVIRETLNRVRPVKSKIKSYSDPPSPSKFKPFVDSPDIEDELLLESDSDVDEEVHPLDEGTNDFDEVINSGVSACIDSTTSGMPIEHDLQRQFSCPERLCRLKCSQAKDFAENEEVSVAQYNGKLSRMLTGFERIGLSWPEPPLDLLSQHVLERPTSFKSVKSFRMSKTFRTYSSKKSFTNDMPSEIALLAELDLESLMKRKRRSSFVRIISKQMVGVFLTIWVRRSLRRYIQNLKVSTVGVGVMGYIGNKGSISVSMSIYQMFFCFICTHLTSGERDGDEVKRNSDVHEIQRRTQFQSLPGIRLPKSIYDHERIIWLGDLNYRINMSYENIQELIYKKEWSKLLEGDQLVRELKKGRAFDGWSEGTLNFPPTYKYENNSEKYCGEDPKAGRRIPSWCDRILSYGKGMKLLSYRRSDLRLSDHRPVTAMYMAEVEVFCPRKLQLALSLTDAEIENEQVETQMGLDS